MILAAPPAFRVRQLRFRPINRPSRKPFPEHLPRERVMTPVREACRQGHKRRSR